MSFPTTMKWLDKEGLFTDYSPKKGVQADLSPREDKYELVSDKERCQYATSITWFQSVHCPNAR